MPNTVSVCGMNERTEIKRQRKCDSFFSRGVQSSRGDGFIKQLHCDMVYTTTKRFSRKKFLIMT